MGDPQTPDAESLFADWLAARDEGEENSLDDLCAAHPQHADVLRALHAEHERQQTPPPVDEGAGRVGTDAWEAILTQLRSRGPNWARYVDEGEVARGGMGAIRRVFDQDVRRSLALKVMLGDSDAPADGGSLGRFLEEAQVTGQLDHPGIVPVHEVGVDAEDRVYFTMKLVKGEDLRAVFDRVADPADDEWTTTRALSVMLRVCEAMAYAHEKGAIHRDLKPGNVMVGKYGEAYVMDWGLAKVLGREDKHDLRIRPDSTESLKTERRDAAAETPDSPIRTMGGDVVGTPAYMPPEQALGKIDTLGPAADVYAVGAMLYHLLAGRTPYTHAGGRMTARTILALVTQGPPPPLADLAPDSPGELVAIVERAMAREIEDRYPDMTALARDLRAYLENRVVAAYETGAWAELKKWVQRNKALAGTAAAAIVAVAALAGWALVERETARENEQSARANEAEAERQRDRADENADEAKIRAKEAEAERDRVLRLSDKRRLDALLEEADALWPAHPEKAEGLRRWLGRTEELLANLPLHEATLAEVRAMGTPIPHPREADLAELREHLEKHAAAEVVEEEEFEGEAARAEHVGNLEAAIASLDAAITRERDHDFGDNADDRWWHDAVRDVVTGIHALKEGDEHGSSLAGIEARLDWAERVERTTTTGAEPAAKWAEARATIKAHSKYGGLDLKPQVGLVPIGPDPESTLWEFAHPQTGRSPSRDADTGELAISEASSLVFVLIPAGEYRVGAQQSDQNEPNFVAQSLAGMAVHPDETPVHKVKLQPFFLSKFEMTQAQWARFTGSNPSMYQPTSDVVKSHLHPVEHVNWNACRETMARLNLTLPTEAQWEAACRAGTETPWSTGLRNSSLNGAANLADQAAKRAGATWPSLESWPESDDGFVVHAPVGSFTENAFGLHDMHGNVWEWCRDHYSNSAYKDIIPNGGDGLRELPGAPVRVNRGGGFTHLAPLARSAVRNGAAPENRGGDLGLRPAKALD